MANYIQMQTAIALMPHFNSMLFRPVISKCGGIEGFFMESEKAFNLICAEFQLKQIPQRKEALLKAEEELNNIYKYDIRCCSFENSGFPPLLKECNDAPLVLFYKGELLNDNDICLAIVGTRRASDRCRERIDVILKELSETCRGVTIVSGLAFGIDGSAHQAAVKYGLKTYAVLGHGLQMIYPAAHKNMAEKIIDSGGALISEFTCSDSILPVNFLKRNRIIAGICRATLIAESAEKGGAMATARIASSYNRDVMAFPGRPEDKMSAGCNLLIKENMAALTEACSDIVKTMGLTVCVNTPTQTQLVFSPENEKESSVLNIIREKGGVNLDELLHLTNIPIHELTVLLFQLELEGKILSLPGNHYITA